MDWASHLKGLSNNILITDPVPAKLVPAEPAPAQAGAWTCESRWQVAGIVDAYFTLYPSLRLCYKYLWFRMSIVSIVIGIFVLLFAVTVHEAAHGWAANKFGDPTAYAMGRVTLNPLAHIDPIGTILFPIILIILNFPVFGWAKPVPVNPLNLKNPRKDNLWISAAGPFSNLSVAAFALLGIIFLKLLNPNVAFFLRNFLLGRGALPRGFYPLEGLALILFYAVLINTYLAVFNLIPVPPLDGSGVLSGLLSEEAAVKYERIRPFGFIIVLGLIYLGLLNLIIQPIQFIIYSIMFM